MIDYKNVFKPNKSASGTTFITLCITWVVGVLTFWHLTAGDVLPKPMSVFLAFGDLFHGDFIHEMITSTTLAMEAVLIAFVVSMAISYLTVMPFFQPIGEFFTKLRYLSLVGLQFVFMLMASGGHSLKIWLLVFSVSVFFVTSMLEELKVPRNEMNHARTLGMSEWRIVYEVKLLGRFDRAYEVLRQNFAMAWMMLTMVEVVSRAEGGIGIMLTNQNKHFQMDQVFAIQISILLIGILIDYFFGVTKGFFCPYACLTQDVK